MIRIFSKEYAIVKQLVKRTNGELNSKCSKLHTHQVIHPH